MKNIATKTFVILILNILIMTLFIIIISVTKNNDPEGKILTIPLFIFVLIFINGILGFIDYFLGKFSFYKAFFINALIILVINIGVCKILHVF